MTVAYRSDTGEMNMNAASGNVQISFVTAPVAGDFVAFGGTYWQNNTNHTPTCTDNQSNTYNLDKYLDYNGDIDPPLPAGAGVALLWAAQNVNSSGTYTITFGGAASNNYGCLAGIAFSGVATSGALDVSDADNSSTAGHTSLTTGPTGTLAVADSLVLTTFMGIDSIVYTGLTISGYTAVALETDGTTVMPGGIAYKIVSSTAAQSATWSWTTNNSTNTDAAVIAVYKGVVNPWTPQTNAPETLQLIAAPRW
jgi:hypothetical protein